MRATDAEAEEAPLLEGILRRNAWRGAIVASLLNALGTPIDVVIGLRVPGTPWLPGILASAVGVFLAAILHARRHDPPPARISSLLFCVNTAVIVWAISISGQHYADVGLMPFQANKLGVFAVALLAPEAWAGLASILAYTLAALVQGALMQRADSEGVSNVAVYEPWATLVFGGFAIVLLGYRLRRIVYERTLLRAEASAHAARRIAELSLWVRDLANSPIQTLTFEVALLRSGAPATAERLDRVQRAIDRLHDLNTRLAPTSEVARGLATTFRPG